MENYNGEVFTLDTGESYLILNGRETARGDLCIGIAMTEPVELKIIETRIGGDGSLEGCLYEGEDYNEICKELLGYEGEDDTEMLMKAMEHLELIRNRLTQ